MKQNSQLNLTKNVPNQIKPTNAVYAMWEWLILYFYHVVIWWLAHLVQVVLQHVVFVELLLKNVLRYFLHNKTNIFLVCHFLTRRIVNDPLVKTRLKFNSIAQLRQSRAMALTFNQDVQELFLGSCLCSEYPNLRSTDLNFNSKWFMRFTCRI